jgi:hypothetical protein
MLPRNVDMFIIPVVPKLSLERNWAYCPYSIEIKVGVIALIGWLGMSQQICLGYEITVDFIASHPHSVDTMCSIPVPYDSSRSAVLTGSSDGMIRAIALFPTKLIGVVAEHGSYPVERMAVDRGGQGRWLGSVGHDDKLRMTDLELVFEKEEENHTVSESAREEEDNVSIGESSTPLEPGNPVEAAVDSDSEADIAPRDKKRKRKGEKGALNVGKKKGRNEVDADASFFAGL